MDINDNKTCSFFGHRWVWNKRAVSAKLKIEIEKLIKRGVKRFLVGTHGEFDKLVLQTLRELKKVYAKIKIVVVFSSPYAFKKGKSGYSKAENYADLETMMYDVETEHYKRQIIKTNQNMIEDSDIVIFYVEPEVTQSGAKTALKYAQNANKQVINIY